VKGYCSVCGKEIDETEIYGGDMCFKCYEKANTIPVNTKNRFKTRNKCDWNKFNDNLYWSS